MVFGPGFAVGGFVFADDEDGDVGFLRGIGGGLHAVLLGLRIDQLDVIGEPAVPVVFGVGDLAAFRVDDVGFGSDAVFDALQDANAVRGLAAVAAEVHAVGVGSDDGDGFQLGDIEGQNVLVVLEQHDCFLCDFQCDGAVLGAVGDFLGIVGIDERILEQGQAEVGGEDAGDRAVEVGFGNGSLFHLPAQGLVDGAVGEVVIDPGRESEARGFGIVCGG